MGAIPNTLNSALFLVGFLAVAGLSSCGGTQEAQKNPTLPPAAAPPSALAQAEPTLTPVQSPPGLNPLPTQSQVVAAVPMGRKDPFAPIPGTRMNPSPAKRPQPPPSPPPLSLPESFRFTGVISSGGGGEAIVELGALSGSVRPGDIGGRTTQLLPQDWKVVSINVSQERLTLQKGERRLTKSL